MKTVVTPEVVAIATDSVTGWSESDALEASLEARLEAHRYETTEDRVLARYEDVPALLPSYDELRAMGLDMARFVDCLDRGLNAKNFGILLAGGMNVGAFNAYMEKAMNIAIFNDGMAASVRHIADAQ